MSAPYLCDFSKVKDLPFCISQYNKNNSYCAAGKLALACGFKVVKNKIDNSAYSDFERDFFNMIGNSLVYTGSNHDMVVNNCSTKLSKKKAHDEFCQKLIKLCVKKGLIKLKGCDSKMVNVAKKLKSARAKKGFTLQQVADKVGSSTGYVHDMENGRRNPSPVMLRKLTKALSL